MSAAGPLRVMLCDDSAAVRGAMARALESDPAIAVVARAGDGRQALAALDAAPPAQRAEVVLLDLEMPVMDGMTALPLLLRREPRPVVIVASALTQRGASATMEALRAGAADYIPKPRAADGGMACAAFRAELLAKVKGWARLSQDRVARRAAAPSPAPPRAAAGAEPPRLLCLGSSTGGPQALAALVRRLPRALPVPVLAVQHMPPGFTAMLARHLDALGGLRCAEAREGDAVEPGRLLLAPGDRHLLLRAEAPGGRMRVALSSGPAENFCRPAFDPLLRSAVAAVGGRLLAVVLTGMGQDGLAGCRAVAAAGGTVWAQDEASSVVWGMPGAVARAGLAAAQAAPEALGDGLAALFAGKGARPC